MWTEIRLLPASALRGECLTVSGVCALPLHLDRAVAIAGRLALSPSSQAPLSTDGTLKLPQTSRKDCERPITNGSGVEYPLLEPLLSFRFRLVVLSSGVGVKEDVEGALDLFFKGALDEIYFVHTCIGLQVCLTCLPA